MNTTSTTREALAALAADRLTAEVKQERGVILDQPTPKRRAMTVAEQAAQVVKVDLNTWRVPSSSRAGAWRIVKRLATGDWQCSCAGHLVAVKHGHFCRHVEAVRSLGHHPEIFRDGLTCCDWWSRRSRCCPRSEEGKAIFNMMGASVWK